MTQPGAEADAVAAVAGGHVYAASPMKTVGSPAGSGRFATARCAGIEKYWKLLSNQSAATDSAVVNISSPSIHHGSLLVTSRYTIVAEYVKRWYRAGRVSGALCPAAAPHGIRRPGGGARAVRGLGRG